MLSYCCVHKPHEASKYFFGVPKNADLNIEGRNIRDET